MKRAVVTGATGMIGQALLAQLLAQGVQVLALCHRESPRLAQLPKSTLLRVQLCDMSEWETLSLQQGAPYDAFFHLGWAGTRGGAREDTALQEKNTRCTAAAVRLAEALGCEVFVGVGSQAEYGPVPVGECAAPTRPCHPTTAYGKQKLAACHLAQSICAAAGMRFVWARVFSVYGEGDHPQSGVMCALRACLRGEVGAFSAGKQIWDYLHVQDAARALALLADCKGAQGIYNVASGESRPLRAFIEEIRDLINPACQLCFGALPYAKGQVMHLCADITSLRADTGFAPQISFSQGILRLAAWQRQQP